MDYDDLTKMKYSSMVRDVRKHGCKPVCAYDGCDENPENLFVHEEEFVCAGCLESHDGLRWNHVKRQFEMSED